MIVKRTLFICLLLAVILAAIYIAVGAGTGKTEIKGISASNETTAGKVQKVDNADISSTQSVVPSMETAVPEIQATPDPETTTDKKAAGNAVPKPTPKPKQEAIVPKAVDDKANTIAKGDVQLEDYLEIFKILSGKLSMSEIKYLFDSARDDYWVKTSVEDIEKARKILFSKLSDDDLEKLDKLGRKYGRSMKIIDKDIDVATVKEDHMRDLGLIE